MVKYCPYLFFSAIGILFFSLTINPCLRAKIPLLQESEINSEDEASEGGDMIPAYGLIVEKEEGKDRKYDEGDDFLYDFEL